MHLLLQRARVAAALSFFAALLGACEHLLDDDGPSGAGEEADARAVGAQCTAQEPCPTAPTACQDLAEYTSWRYSARADDGAASTKVLVTTPADVVRGARAMRLQTSSGALAWLRYQAPTARPIDARGMTLELAVRGHNTNAPTWQGHAPVIRLVDTKGGVRTLIPDRQLLSDDGVRWTRVSVPLAGGVNARGDASFLASGVVDLGTIAAVEIGADTWGAGFLLDVDSLAFVGADQAADGCTLDCPGRCSRQGVCDQESVTCACDVGATGADCGTCASGFIEEGAGASARCVLPDDASFAEWPNDRSRANSDPWLAVHHDEIEVLRPKVLALHFVNPTSLADAQALVDDVIAAFARASEPRDGGTPALQYTLARPLVDLRDGVEGRAPAPAGYPFENSTLTPRKSAPDGSTRADYAALFSSAFAARYGFVDSSGAPADLCTLVNVGAVHEVWLLVSGDVPDAAFAETLEMKATYDAAGNRLDAPPTPCAGNGCFEADVPSCGRSLRVLTVNVRRGPGCALHSFGHGVEGMGTRGIVPGLDAWLEGYAGFDLDARYGVPHANLYELGCEDADGDGHADSQCVAYPLQDAAIFHDRGATSVAYPYDARCGNVHFPPNATWHYEYGSVAPVSSSCVQFGRSNATAPVEASAWTGFEQDAPDCGGGFLIWWLRHMPRFGSGQSFEDGTPMKPMWPFLFY